MNDTATTNATYIRITWLPVLDTTREVCTDGDCLDDTGRSPVFYYKLEWDQGGSKSSYTLNTGAATTMGPVWQELTTGNNSVLSFA